MQTLQIIMSIMSILAYVALATFACFAFNRLRQQQSVLRTIEIMLGKVMIVTMAEHLKSSFDNLNEMKERLQELIEDDRFEEAAELKMTIIKAEALALSELERFKKEFGEDCVDLKVTSIRRG